MSFIKKGTDIPQSSIEKGKGGKIICIIYIVKEKKIERLTATGLNQLRHIEKALSNVIGLYTQFVEWRSGKDRYCNLKIVIPAMDEIGIRAASQAMQIWYDTLK